MALQFSEINFNDEKKNKKRKNVTLKNAKKPHEKIQIPESSNNLGQHFLNNNGDDSDDDLGDFHTEQKVNMPALPKITNFPTPKTNTEPLVYKPNIDSYSANQANTNSSYYEHFVPNYQKLADSQNLNGGQNELMTKLNHILHLLEEQQDQKTSNVTEELILYLFLGVFVIFTVDSFTKVGKYTR
tara:strand:- start:242 stop:796 length:555 start_codon:yes stop_codon:yes gene_type:complete